MRQWTLSLAVVALIAGTSFAGKFNTKIALGDKAPAISGITAVEGDKDSTLNLADIKEDVVVVAFLANHCPAVVANEDRLVDVANSFKGKSVKFVGVCCSNSCGEDGDVDGVSAIKTKFKEGKYAGNTVYGIDPAGTIGKAFGATRTPEFFVLDKTRTVKYMGAMDDSPHGRREGQQELPEAGDRRRPQQRDGRSHRDPRPGLRHLLQALSRRVALRGGLAPRSTRDFAAGPSPAARSFPTGPRHHLPGTLEP